MLPYSTWAPAGGAKQVAAIATAITDKKYPRTERFILNASSF
jgi:hypothetical protein